MAVSYNAIRNNSRLTQFQGTKEMVLMNSIPKVNFKKEADTAIQSQLFQF